MNQLIRVLARGDKMNNKGFMMAEVIVVSAIVLTLLSSVYVNYNKLYGLYSSRIDYYDVVTLYRLGYYRDYLIENNTMNTKINDAKNNSNKITEINKIYNEDRVFMINNNKTRISSDTLNWINSQTDMHQTFKDYISYLSTSDDLDNKSNYVLIMERCNIDNDCKYAYLEVYDGYE